LQGFRQFAQPLLFAVRLDVVKRHPIDARGSAVGTAQPVGERQDVRSIHLVVQHVKAIVGRSLRFGVQCRLQLLNLWWSCQTHVNLLGRVLLLALTLN
jgi:hypothetical protein